MSTFPFLPLKKCTAPNSEIDAILPSYTIILKQMPSPPKIATVLVDSNEGGHSDGVF